MRAEYDLSNAKKNPYIEKHRKPVTMNLDVYVLDLKERQIAPAFPTSA